MNRVIDWFARNTVAANLLMVFIIVSGAISAFTVKQEVLPEYSLAMLAEALRLANALLPPVMPGINAKINELLGLPPTEIWNGVLDWGTTLEGNQLGEKTILFPRA